jgi:undecaprenyl-diphosphatase
MGLQLWGKKFVAKVLPFVITPVAIGAGVTVGAIYFFNRLARDVRGREKDGLWQFDQSGLELALRLRTPRRTTVMQSISHLARPDAMTWVGVGSMLVALLVPKVRPRAILLSVALAGGGMMIGTIKYRYARVRPTLIEALTTEGTFSFPSGHSFIAVVLYGILAYWAMQRYRSPWERLMILGATLKMILLIGASRVYLGVHYPSDVLAGYAAATPWLTACLISYHQFETRNEPLLLAADDAD